MTPSHLHAHLRCTVQTWHKTGAKAWQFLELCPAQPRGSRQPICKWGAIPSLQNTYH